MIYTVLLLGNDFGTLLIISLFTGLFVLVRRWFIREKKSEFIYKQTKEPDKILKTELFQWLFPYAISTDQLIQNLDVLRKEKGKISDFDITYLFPIGENKQYILFLNKGDEQIKVNHTGVVQLKNIAAFSCLIFISGNFLNMHLSFSTANQSFAPEYSLKIYKAVLDFFDRRELHEIAPFFVEELKLKAILKAKLEYEEFSLEQEFNLVTDSKRIKELNSEIKSIHLKFEQIDYFLSVFSDESSISQQFSLFYEQEKFNFN